MSTEMILTKAKLLLPQQSGFRPQHSCVTALTHVTDSWLSSINEGKMVGAMFIDLQKAFDSIDHSILLEKLRIYGCNQMSIEWFTSYLSDRQQQVKFNEASSSFQNIKLGVPQGSILGPLMFLLFINDLPLHLSHCKSDIYADDTTIYVEGKNLKDIEDLLNIDAASLYRWCIENSLTINVKKTKCMLIATSQRMRTIKSSLQVYINNARVPVSSCEKLLGVHIQDTMDWSSHVDYVSKLVKSNLYLLKRIRPYLSLHARKMFCNSYVYSHLDYLCTVWGNTTKENLNRLLLHQKHAARLTLDDYNSESSKLFSKLNWLPIESRIAYNKEVLVYKALTKMCPQYLKDLLPYQTNSVYNMRSEAQKKLYVPKVNYEIFRRSLTYSGPNLWNQLPQRIQSADSLAQFKKSCMQHHMTAAFP